MEGVSASRYTIKVDTRNARVEISTTSYNGGISGVGLYVSSNVVISSSPQNSVVVYATGSVVAGTYFGDGSKLSGVGETNTYASSKTFTSDVLGKSSITAVSFFGDGSHLTSLPSTEANTYASSKTFTNDVLGKSSITASGFFGSIHRSSVTVPFTGATAATAFSTCYATQTIVTSGGKVAVWYSGALHNSGAGAGCITGFLEDGKFIDPFTSAIGNGVGISHSANAPSTASFYVVIRAPAAGSHDYCITLAALANTCNFSAFSYAYNEFGVMEIQ